jgi:hypothetical protein
MNKSLLSSIFLVLVSTLFLSCENKEPIRCVINSPTVTNNSPVLSGGQVTFNLVGYSPESGATFYWTGPNGFESTLQNPIIPNATSAMSGEYSVKVKIGICETEEVKTSITVLNNTVTCNQADDTASFTNIGNPQANFYNFGATAISNNKYEIRASDFRWSIKAQFLGQTPPTTGFYTVVNPSTPLTASTVHLLMTYTLINGNQVNYTAKSGDVSLSYTTNQKAIIKFCSVPFSLSNSNNTDTVGSAKYTQQ